MAYALKAIYIGLWQLIAEGVFQYLSVSFRAPQPIRIDPLQRVPAHIGVGVEATRQTDGVGLEVAAGAGVVVAESVVVEPALGVEILAREALVVVGGASSFR